MVSQLAKESFWRELKNTAIRKGLPISIQASERNNYKKNDITFSGNAPGIYNTVVFGENDFTIILHIVNFQVEKSDKNAISSLCSIHEKQTYIDEIFSTAECSSYEWFQWNPNKQGESRQHLAKIKTDINIVNTKLAVDWTVDIIERYINVIKKLIIKNWQ